jgi:hypothetical protein
MGKLAEKAEGRVISVTLHLRLIPPDEGINLGEVDAAHDIGMGLVREAVHLLYVAAEREGFKVEGTFNQVVY